MDLRSRAGLAIAPVLFCIACGTDTGGASSARSAPADVPASATASTTELPFDAARPAVRALATAFLRAALEHDARSTGRLDFLADVAPLVTDDELTRLARSPRAQLPWRLLRARGERTIVSVQGASESTTKGPEVQVLLWVRLTTRTSFATVQQRDLVTLAVLRDGSTWKVDDAEGAGL